MILQPDKMNLAEIGFDSFFSANCTGDGLLPGRIISESRNVYTLICGYGEIPAEATGKLVYGALGREDLPAVGDWIEFSPVDDGTRGIIHRILPRKTSLKRKAVGKPTDSQVIAANIDIVFIVQGLDGNFNQRRLERYIIAVKASGAKPVVLLSKSDLHSPQDVGEFIAQAKESAKDVEIMAYSSHDMDSVDLISTIIGKGVSTCFVGSSGVGKSTLINKISGSDIATAEVRAGDSKGRHTTSRKSLMFLENGGMVIDTPGMREIGILDTADGIDGTFPEIAELSDGCRFRDCTHTDEPECAVLNAVECGDIEQKRYESYIKLMREAEYMRAKMNEGTRTATKRRTKHYKKWIREVDKFKGRT
ncbi:ribosome small subunit-dependent GTPase A [Candidatus Latescibacterota bacterium]